MKGIRGEPCASLPVLTVWLVGCCSLLVETDIPSGTCGGCSGWDIWFGGMSVSWSGIPDSNIMEYVGAL